MDRLECILTIRRVLFWRLITCESYIAIEFVDIQPLPLTGFIFLPTNRHFEYLYYDRGLDRTTMHRKPHTLTRYPDELQKKVTLLKHFKGYMKNNLFKVRVLQSSAALRYGPSHSFRTLSFVQRWGMIQKCWTVIGTSRSTIWTS